MRHFPDKRTTDLTPLTQLGDKELTPADDTIPTNDRIIDQSKLHSIPFRRFIKEILPRYHAPANFRETLLEKLKDPQPDFKSKQ